jgi:sulfite exporter TauE/SafE
MEAIAAFTAFCREDLHELAALPASLPLSLGLAGLAGSLTHCVGMCGPFVLSQVVADSGGRTGHYGEWQRLAGAALAPYHLGRLTTYTLLGAVVGAVTALSIATTGFVWLSAIMLTIAAILMILQALGLALGAASPLSAFVTRVAAPLLSSRTGTARYALGTMLGLLPCGLLYGALAAAAGTGSPYEGALAMVAFGLGTVPALIVIGWLGLIARRRLSGVAHWLAMPLLIANALLMLALAAQRLAV